MYSVSKEMPLASYQVVNPAENATNFLPGQPIRFTVPRSIGFWDSHLSRLQLLVKTQNSNYKMCFNSPTAGIASFIDMIRISQNGTTIAELLNYNQIQHCIKSYELPLSGLQQNAVEKGIVDYIINGNTGDKALSNGCLVGQGVNRIGCIPGSAPTAAASMLAMEQDVKFSLTLDFVSLFEILEVVPSLFMGDLLFELRVASSIPQILKVLPSTNIVHTLSTNWATAATTIALTPPFLGFTNLADSPYIVGQKVRAVRATDGLISATDYTIEALSQAVATGIITITVNAIQAVDNGYTQILIVSGADGLVPVAPNLQFIVSRAELLLQVVKPPQQYIQQLASQVENGQFFIDLDSYTSYSQPVLTGIKSQPVIIPTTQSRVKSFFTVLRKTSQSSTLSPYNDLDFNYNGQFGNLRYYRTQINGEYYPNIPIDCGVMCGGWHFSMEHHRELQKAFDSAGIPMRSILGLKQNFVIGRALSSYGSSTDLTGKPITLYLEYDGNSPLVYGTPSALTVGTAGTGYTTTVAGDRLTTTNTSGTGNGMTVSITAAAGAITAATIIEAGSGYVNGDMLTVKCTGVNDLAAATGTITGYTNGEIFSVTGGTGTGLAGTITVVGGNITALTITAPGRGYTTGDDLTIVGATSGANTAKSISTVSQDGTVVVVSSQIGLEAISFVHHSTRIAISPMGIDVMN